MDTFDDGESVAMHGQAAPGQGETVVTEPAWLPVLLWVGFPLLGAGAGWLLKLLTSWLASLSWFPFQGPLRLIDSVPEPLATIGALALGVVAGLVLGLLSAADMLTVTVADDRVTTMRGDTDRTVDGESVSAAFVDGKDLVLLGPDTGELLRERSDLGTEQLAAAFRAHGYPWLEGGDPYAEDYRRWVEDMPNLPAGANALLKARDKALRADDSHDVAELRGELAKLGVIVRDRNKRQYWRTITG